MMVAIITNKLIYFKRALPNTEAMKHLSNLDSKKYIYNDTKLTNMDVYGNMLEILGLVVKISS